MKTLLLGCTVVLMTTASLAQTPPLRVAIAGLAHGHVAGFFEHSLQRPDIQLVGIAESDSALASRYAGKFNLDRSIVFTDLETMLQKTHPQAVLAYSSTFDHRRIVEICARHGIHVMMEKPLAVSYEDAVTMQTAAQAAKIHVLVNYETTWYNSNRTAYQLLHQGMLGELRKVVVHDGHQGPKEIGVPPEFFTWLNDPKLNGGGALYDFGCYGADLMTWLMDGKRPSTVTAVTQRFKPEIYNVDDEATIILTYPKAQAILQASWNWPFDRKDMEVYGRTGYVITAGHDDVRLRLAGKPEERRAEAVAPPQTDSLTYLRGVLLEGAKPDGPSSLEINMVVAEILDAARRSAASGQTIRLERGQQ